MAGIRKAGLFAGALGLLFVGAIAGCGGGDDNLTPTRANAAALPGIWNKVGLGIPGKSVTCPNTLTTNSVTVDSCVARETLSFASDGTYRVTYPAPRFTDLATEEGRYEVDGSTLTLTRTRIGYDTNKDGVIATTEVTAISPQRIVYTISVSGNTMHATAVQQQLIKSDGTRYVNSDGSINVAILTVDGTPPVGADIADPSNPLPNITLSAADITFEKQLGS